MSDPANHKLAVLIDADNAQASIIEGLLAEVAKYGYAKLSGLLKAIGLFTLEERVVGRGPHKAIYVRAAGGRD